MTDSRFWKTTPLSELTEQQWESLCDGCARCCLIKLQDEESGKICTTNLACRYLELGECRCTQYQERTRLVPQCVKLTPENLSQQFHYMPQSCAYRRIYESGDLPVWHPLLSGNREEMEAAGISISFFAESETVIEDEEDLFDHVLDCDE